LLTAINNKNFTFVAEANYQMFLKRNKIPSVIFIVVETDYHF